MFKLKLIPSDTHVPFMRWRRLAMSISLALALLSLVGGILPMLVPGLGFLPGLNFGIDFRGGTLVEVRTPQAARLADMRAALSGLGLGDVNLQEFGDERDVLIRVQRQPGGADAQQAAVEKVRAALDDLLGAGIDYRRVEFVGPKVSEELVEAGTIAVLLAVSLMLVYIWFRFEWYFALGAIAALVHDVLLSIGIFAVTQITFDLATIAALLTIIGYSINDTVVVYDRVRENLRKYKTKPIEEVLDLSLNDTLSRTTMTSLTTLLALVALFLFGGAVIQGFVFAMIWGVLVGTYSSVFIAAPLLVTLGISKHRRSEAEREAAEAAATRR